MWRTAAVAALVCLALLASPTAAAGFDRQENASVPRIVAVVPNPVAREDRGEHLVIAFPEPTSLGDWSVGDDEAVVEFPNRTVSGRVAVSPQPEAVVGGDPVLGIDGSLALANGGETLSLRRGNRTVSTVTFENAPEGEIYAFTETGWEWRHAGMTDFPVVSVADPRVRAFVLPDAPNETVGFLRAARDRVLLAGYTFETARVTRTLCALRDRNVSVRVLVEREPVGGLTTRAATRFDRLSACGVSVRLLGGPSARYPFHHAKYAVVDDAAIVLSENWKRSGVGGRSNRGWGVVIRDAAFATRLADLFRADASWRDAGLWGTVTVDPVAPLGPPSSERFPARFEPRRFTPERADLLVSPDNAEDAVVALLDDATESIAIQQVSIGSRRHPFVNATLRAARRGVRVRVLLSSADYVFRENHEMVVWLNAVADRRGLPVEARLVDPRSRYGVVHVKGVIADDAVLVGSLNWNAYASRKNREVSVVLHGDAVAAYYRRVFRADWRGGVWRVPVTALGVVVVGVLACAWTIRRMRFAPQSARSP